VRHKKRPVSFIAHFQLGIHLIKAGRYSEASEALERATRLNSSPAETAETWRELGVAYSKAEKLDEATAALEKSLNLDSSHNETWSNLGGLRRRKSRRGGQIVDWSELRKSLAAYQTVLDRERNNSYAGFNAALLNLMITLHEGQDASTAVKRFETLEKLCSYEVENEEKGDDRGWKHLNLAGTLAVLGRRDEAVAEVHCLWASTAEVAKKSYADSATPPLRDLLQTGGLKPEQEDAIRAVIAVLEGQ
jgi:tetratricopeptide (TPR) repeat protein